jgi:hypothetical protein
MDKMGVGLNETSIIFEGSSGDEAWRRFIASLKKNEGEKPEREEKKEVQEPPPIALPPSPKGKSARLIQYRWIGLIAAIGFLAGGLAIWKFYLAPSIKVASIDRMKHPLPDKPSIAVLLCEHERGPRARVFRRWFDRGNHHFPIPTPPNFCDRSRLRLYLQGETDPNGSGGGGVGGTLCTGGKRAPGR